MPSVALEELSSQKITKISQQARVYSDKGSATKMEHATHADLNNRLCVTSK